MQIWKPCNKKWRHNGIITKNNGKNADLRETKQIIYHSNYFIEFEPQCQKLWAFMLIFGIFYYARSSNMAMSRDPRSKFRKKIIFS